MAKNEIARPKVILDGQQAEQELENLTAKAKKYRDAMLEAAAAGDSQAQKRLQQQLKSTNTEIRNLKKEAFDVDRVLKNINGASFNELSQAVRKATTDLKKMQQTDPGYAAQKDKVVALKTKLGELTAEQKVHTPLWSRMAEGANKYFSIITAGAASLAGLVLGMKKVVQTFNDYEERVSNLSALTGLTGEPLKWLSDKAKELSQSVQDGGIRITKSAQDIVDAFTKMGSARPELLQNKEALVEVTKKALILAEASKMEMQPAIDAVAASMNQFNMGADQSSRIINTLAAGSLAGSSEVDNITESLANVGTVAADSNMNLEQTVGTLETLAERQLRGADAGTQLRSSLISLKAAGLGYASGVFNMRDAIIELKAKMDAKSTAQEKDNVLIEVFGKRNITVGTILAQNIERYDYFTKAVTGTNAAMEQAAINTDNNNAKLAQAKNRINILSIELGEKLSPAMTLVTGYFGKMLAVISYLVDVFTKYGRIIITTTAAIAGYTIAVKLATLWETRSNAEKGIGLALTKLKVFWHGAERGALLLSAAAQALLSGNIARATAAMRLFNIETKLNPVGLLIGILAAATAAIYMYSRGLTDAQKAQKVLNDVNLTAQKNIVEEKTNVQTLLNLARNEKLTKEQRLKAIQALNEINPKYIHGLTLENINTKTATDAVKDYTDALLENAKAQAAKEKLVEIEKELLDLQAGKGADVTFWQGAWNGIKTGGNIAAASAKNAETATNNLTDRQAELNLQKEKLLKITEKQAEADLKTGGKGGGNNNNAAKDLIKLKEEELQKINEEIAATPAEIASRNKRAEALQNEINKLKELGTSKQGKTDDKEKDKAYKDLDIANRKELNLIKQHQLEVNATEDEYNKILEQNEMEALNKKLALQIKFGDDTSDTMAAILDKQLKIQEEADKKTEEEKKKLHKKELDDLDNQQKNELAAIKKDALAKGLSDEQTNALLITKEIEYLNKKLVLNQKYGEDVADVQAAIAEKINELAENAIKGDEERAKNLADLKKKYLDEEVTAEQEKLNALADLDAASKAGLITSEEEYQKLKTAINKKYEAERFNKISKYAEAAQNILGGVSDYFAAQKDKELAKAGDDEAKKEAIEAKYAKKQQAIGAFQAGVNGAVAIMQLWAQPSALPEPANSIYKGVMTAVIAATTIAQVAAINSKSFSSGGFTEPGDKNKPTGIVHAGEYVIPQEGVKSPGLRPIIDIIELARKNGTIAQVNIPEVLAATGPLSSGGKQSGGFANNSSGSAASPIIIPSSGKSISDHQLDRLNTILDKLNSKDFSISVEMYEKVRNIYDSVTSAGLK